MIINVLPPNAEQRNLMVHYMVNYMFPKNERLIDGYIRELKKATVLFRVAFFVWIMRKILPCKQWVLVHLAVHFLAHTGDCGV